jgi:hypothetical protein
MCLSRSIHRVFSFTLGLPRNMGVSRTITVGWVPYSKWKKAATLSSTNNKSKPLELSKKGQRSPTPIERADQTPHDSSVSRLSVYPAFEKLFRFIPEPRTGQKLPD